MSDHQAALSRAQEHIAAGRLDQARAVIGRILDRAPAQPHANGTMAQVLLRKNDPDRAMYYAERAAAAAPPDPGFLSELGKLFINLGHPERGVVCLREAIAAAPTLPAPRAALSAQLIRERRFAAGARECREGLAGAPDHPDLAGNLGMCLTQMGRAPEGMGVLRAALDRHPHHLSLLSNLAGAANYCPGVDPAEVLRLHQSFGEVLARLRPSQRFPDRPSDPERRLTVSFLSPDYEGHSVGFFIRPILTHLDRAQFRVVWFSTAPRLPGDADGPPPWDAVRDVHTLTDEQLVAAVRADGTDILLELSGHTAGHRLTALPLRGAPVQATYLGYPNTTGVGDADARIVDSLTDPPPAADALATEGLQRLDPCFLCYAPGPDAPPVGSPPAGAPVTFASFNAIAKLNDGVIRLWVRVLSEVPGSQLLLKAGALEEEEVRADLRARFSAAGLDPGRLELVASVPAYGEHMRMYGRVDVALDTFPYNGTTTTAEALWMGVPVVTLLGSVHAGRVGLSMLTAAGLPGLVASTPEDYLRIAVGLALDHARRAEFRAALRDRLARSTLCDGPGMGRRFGESLRTIWRDRCARSRV